MLRIVSIQPRFCFGNIALNESNFSIPWNFLNCQCLLLTRNKQEFNINLSILHVGIDFRMLESMRSQENMSNSMQLFRPRR